MTMSSAAAALGGSPAPAAAPAAAPAPAANTPAPAAPSPAPAPGAAPAPAPAANADSWFTGIADESARTWVQAKGFKDPAALAESAYNLEKLIGHDRAGRTLVLPKDDATPEEIKAFHQKLGVPDTPEGYKLPVPDGADPAFSQQAAQWMHKAGIPPKQAEALAQQWNEFAVATEAQAREEQTRVAAREFGELTTEWGPQADAKIELAKRAAAQFIPAANAEERQAMLTKLEGAIGTKAMMTLFANIGAGLGEARVVDGSNGGGGNGFGMSQQQAAAKIESLKQDKAWTAAYIGGDPAKKAEFAQLFAVAYPGA